MTARPRRVRYDPAAVQEVLKGCIFDFDNDGQKGDSAAETDPRMINSEGKPFGPHLVRMLRQEAECLDDPIGFDDRCRIAGVLLQAADYIAAIVEGKTRGTDVK